MRSTAVRRLAVAAVVTALVPVRPAVAVRAVQAPFPAIQAMLERRASAMLDGREAAFMATVDRADAGFVRRQRLLFRGFQRLGLEDYRLRATTRYWPELTTRRETTRYGPSAVPTVLHVEERYRLRGYDPQPALEDLYLTFVRRNGTWLVASDTDLDDVALFSGRKLWELGPIVTRESEHFRYIAHPDLVRAATPVLASAERALETVRQRWPLQWHQRVLILAPTTSEELRRMIQATFDLDVFVAFAYSSVDRVRDWDLVGHRIILNWPNFSRYTDRTQQLILTHELLHIATREISGPAVPAFVDEGIAEWVAGDTTTYRLQAEVERGTFDQEVPRDYEFFTGSQDDIIGAYQESSAAARYAVDRFGPDRVAEFYRVLGAARRVPGTPRYHVDRAMRAVFDVPFETFEDRWGEWLEETV